MCEHIPTTGSQIGFLNPVSVYRSLNPFVQQQVTGFDMYDCVRSQSSLYVPRIPERSTLMGRGTTRRKRLPAEELRLHVPKKFRRSTPASGRRRRSMRGGTLLLPGEMPRMYGGMSRKRSREDMVPMMLELAQKIPAASNLLHDFRNGRLDLTQFEKFARRIMATVSS